MFNKLKQNLKKVLYFGVKNDLYKPIRKEVVYNIVSMIFMTPLFVLFANWVVAIANRKRILFVYDLRACTYRYDFVTGLSLAAVVAQEKNKMIDFLIYDNPKAKRMDTHWIDESNVKHYLTSIVLESVELFPSINNIIYCDSFLKLLQHRSNYLLATTVPFFYSAIRPSGMYDPFYMAQHYYKFGHSKPIKTTKTFDKKLNQWLLSRGLEKYITLTWRAKSEERSEWNTENHIICLRELIAKIKFNVPGLQVVVVPDFSDPYMTTNLEGAILCSEAALSVRFRASLYAESSFNIISTNGPAVIIQNMDCKALYIGLDDLLESDQVSRYYNRDTKQIYVTLTNFVQNSKEITNKILAIM